MTKRRHSKCLHCAIHNVIREWREQHGTLHDDGERWIDLDEALGAICQVAAETILSADHEDQFTALMQARVAITAYVRRNRDESPSPRLH